MTMTFYRQLYDPLFCILVLCAVSKAILADDCLRDDYCLPPATGKGIRYFPQKKSYEMGDIINNTCDNTADYIFGNYQMTCGRNGIWNGDIPACARREEISEISYNNGNIKLPFPNEATNCGYYISGTNSTFNVTTKNEIFGTIVVQVLIEVFSFKDISSDEMVSVHVPGEGERCTLFETDKIGYCLPPATEKGILYFPQKKSYEMGDIIIYTCDNTEDYIFGNYQMKCGKNGNWNGDIPACARREEISEISYNNGDIKYRFPNDTKNRGCYTSETIPLFDVTTKNEIFGTIVVEVGFRVLSVENISSEEMVGVDVPREGERCILFEAEKIGELDYSFEFKCEIKKSTRLFQIRRIPRWDVNLCDINIYTRPKTQCAPDFQICNGGLHYTKPKTEIPHGGNISVYCEEGYRLEGDNHLQCKYGRFIYSTEPKCSRVVCRSIPPPVTNGSWAEWDTSKEFFYGYHLTVICDSGYEFAGKMNFTECQADGSWARAHATCLKKDTATSLGLISIIVGSVIGLVVLLILVLLLVFFLKKKKRTRFHMADVEFQNEKVDEADYPDIQTKFPCTTNSATGQRTDDCQLEQEIVYESINDDMRDFILKPANSGTLPQPLCTNQIPCPPKMVSSTDEEGYLVPIMHGYHSATAERN